MTTTGRRTVARRTVLQSIGAGSIAALAGCTSDGDGAEEEDIEPEAVTVDESATWRTATITDVTTDEEFQIETFDRPVLVHTFSIGCAVCRSQQVNFDDLYATAGDDVEIVDLTIDPNENRDELRSYVDEEGFDWRFVVSSEDVTESLISDFGREVTSSRDSPVVIACPDGDVYRLEKIVDASEIETVLEDVC